MTRINPVDARTASQWVTAGDAVLVDVREADEHAREHIPGALHLPLSGLKSAPRGAIPADGRRVVFHCRSGSRTLSNAADLEAASPGDAFVLEGGLDAWKRADLPTRIDRSRPIDVMRQVQIAAGSLVVAGVVLGWFLSPWFLVLAGFVGSGLVFAGATGFCGMARILSAMPWNRVTPAGFSGRG